MYYPVTTWRLVFEWDENKNRANRTKHGISFDTAFGVFADPNSIMCADLEPDGEQQAHRLLHKCTAELRRLQTDGHYAQELFFEGADTSDIGIADWRAVTKAHGERTRVELRQHATMQTQFETKAAKNAA